MRNSELTTEQEAELVEIQVKPLKFANKLMLDSTGWQQRYN